MSDADLVQPPRGHRPRARLHAARRSSSGAISGDGAFTKRCHALLEQITGARKALLTTSCTHALEMAALLLDIAAGRRGHLPVVHVRLDGQRLRAARRAAGVRRHPARHAQPRRDARSRRRSRRGRGRSSSSTTPASAARWTRSWPIAARHGICRSSRTTRTACSAATRAGRSARSARWRRSAFTRPRTSPAARAARCSINDERFVERAEIIREKGTNRSRFFRGQVDRYTWVDVGSSYLPSDLLAAYLLAQLEARDDIQRAAAGDLVAATRRRSRPGPARGAADCRSCRPAASTRRICSTCCCRRSRRARALIAPCARGRS